MTIGSSLRAMVRPCLVILLTVVVAAAAAAGSVMALPHLGIDVDPDDGPDTVAIVVGLAAGCLGFSFLRPKKAT